MKQPANVVFLAAELAAAGVPSSRAAISADKLCRWGRTFNRISERLCGGEKEWGRWSDDVAKLQARAERRLDTLERQCANELVGFRRIKIQRVSLHLVCLAATAETPLL